MVHLPRESETKKDMSFEGDSSRALHWVSPWRGQCWSSYRLEPYRLAE